MLNMPRKGWAEVTLKHVDTGMFMSLCSEGLTMYL